MRVVLLDDDQHALHVLEQQLLQFPNIVIVQKFCNPAEGKHYILEHEIDLIFMEMELLSEDGVALAEEIIKHKPHIQLVIISRTDKHAIKAFELHALDYLLKPVNITRLQNTMKRVRQLPESAPRSKVSKTELPTLHIHMFGQFAIISEGEILPPLRWRTTRAQELFLYLLQNRGQLVRKSTLIELLWPEYEPSRGYSLLYTVVYHMRKTLKVFESYFKIINTVDGYMLSTNNITLDVEQWESFMMKEHPLTNETIKDYAATMKLYTDDYLRDYDYWWAESERQRLKMQWLRTSFRIAEWYAANQQTTEAIEKYLEICQRHPLAEEAYFELMKIYASAKNSLAVHRQYRLLSSILLEELNEEPSIYITEWYEQWSQKK